MGTCVDTGEKQTPSRSLPAPDPDLVPSCESSLNTRHREAGTLPLGLNDDINTQTSQVTCVAAEPPKSKPTWFAHYAGCPFA